jgi:hypothetical protein
MVSFGMLRRVALVRTDVSEELSASFIRVTRIGELGTLAVTSNRRSVRYFHLSEMFSHIVVIFAVISLYLQFMNLRSVRYVI